LSVIKKRIQKGKTSKYYYYHAGMNGTGFRKCLFVTRLEDAKRIQLELDLHQANIKLGLVSTITDINLSDAINHWDQIPMRLNVVKIVGIKNRSDTLGILKLL
jgi:hypothetical protein